MSTPVDQILSQMIRCHQKIKCAQYCSENENIFGTTLTSVAVTKCNAELVSLRKKLEQMEVKQVMNYCNLLIQMGGFFSYDQNVFLLEFCENPI